MPEFYTKSAPPPKKNGRIYVLFSLKYFSRNWGKAHALLFASPPRLLRLLVLVSRKYNECHEPTEDQTNQQTRMITVPPVGLNKAVIRQVRLGVTCHMRSHRVTCHQTQVNAPHLTPARKAGTRFTYPRGMEG